MTVRTMIDGWGNTIPKYKRGEHSWGPVYDSWYAKIMRLLLQVSKSHKYVVCEWDVEMIERCYLETQDFLDNPGFEFEKPLGENLTDTQHHKILDYLEKSKMFRVIENPNAQCYELVEEYR